ncbi:rhodanese-like domain-containing protein [Roseinatronobacter bogoriensis]|nr:MULTISPECIES: rhodanese-like domain-containing protein [Rhodobaca]MBB4207984.1 rhodanese-related sulfurtransferase [Rhodobaca bogoriensis DSM 18756]TDW38623.1 rhodanese-related sulfurtransferase [Rhodobaca barguzinensis]TDY69338.1 rhodanese-related sulfurtransferase [Rhodobaca bogoriensis DSM 18756]
MRAILAYCLTASLAFAAQADANDLADELGAYLDFAGYTEGVIMVEQLTPDILPDVTFVDARSAAEYAEDGVEGALNIEWREIVERLGEVPTSGMVVVYCNTAVLSTQAVLVARLLGRSNVLVLQGGLAALSASGL